ncbi:MAG: DUF3108 domain-containing protein [Verrucomicrobiota bacterium]
MPRLLPTLALLCLAALPSLTAQPALQPGEAFTYRVSWGLLGKVGEINVSEQSGATPDVSSIAVNTRTSGLARLLFPFEGTARSFFDRDDGQLLRASASTKSRRKSTEASIVFDYEAAQTRYTDHLNPRRDTVLALPGEPPLELITSLIRARDYNLKPGEARTVSVLFDDEIYELRLRAGDYETIETADGKVSALRVTPEPVGEPKGMFKRGGAIRVWLADDAGRLPVRLEVELKVGTAVALLTEHSAPPAPVETAMVSPTTPGPHTPPPPAGRL